MSPENEDKPESPIVYSDETIIFSPLNTPILSLTNENASINYTSDGVTNIGEPVSSTAALYLNGEIIDSEVL
jgi:hypothetical protein